MITLYHSPNTRSGGIVWLLEELDVPYETKLVTFRRADGTGEKDPANPHPHGKVPALHDDGESPTKRDVDALQKLQRILQNAGVRTQPHRRGRRAAEAPRPGAE